MDDFDAASIRVLYVDGDSEMADLTATNLERADPSLTVVTETSADDGLARLATTDVDCVVVDCGVSEADAVEFLAAVRETHRDLPVVLFVRNDSTDVAIEGVVTGVATELQNSSGQDPHGRLAAAIRSAVTRHRADRDVGDVRRAIETARVGVGVLDEEGQFTYVNEAYADLYGYDPWEVVGLPWEARYRDADDDGIHEPVLTRVEEDGFWRGRLGGERRDGEMIALDHSIALAADGGFVCVVTDLTERETRERGLTRLHDATRELMQCSTADSVAERATAAAQNVLGMRVCGVYLADDRDRLVPAAVTPESRELFDEVPTFHVGEGMIGRVFETREPIVSDDAPNHPAVYNPETPIRSELILPLGDHGVFVASSTERGAFQEPDVALARVLAANTSTALDRIGREQAFREQQRRIEALHEIAAELESCTTEGGICELAAETAEDLLGFGVCVVEQAVNGTLRGVASSSDTPPDDYHEEKPLHEGVYGRTFRTGETQLVDDVLGGAEPTPDRIEYRSLLSVKIGDFGVFRVVSEGAGDFDEADRELVELLVTHADEALRRVRREQAARNLHVATRELVYAETERDIAEIAVETARDLLDLSLTTVQLYDEGDEMLHPVAYTDETAALFDDVPSIEPGGSIIWRAFSAGSVEVHDDVRDDPDVMNPDTVVRSQIILPLGSYGVLVCNSTEIEDFDENDVTLAKILARNTQTALDRTARERLLIERSREIQRQNERLEQFASIVSHDLRNPLNVAAGNLQRVREECDSDHLEPIERAHSRMTELIEGVLSLSRHGQSIGDFDRAPLRRVVDTAWSTVETQSATLATPDDLPEVDADETRLRELLENLVRNAIEHAGSDVTVTVGRCGGGFYVEDDGPGIPEGERAQVFEWGHSTAVDGTGLGLNIVKQIAEAHGWEVVVTEGADGGARFEITEVEVVESRS